jgi:hypothetical protein
MPLLAAKTAPHSRHISCWRQTKTAIVKIADWRHYFGWDCAAKTAAIIAMIKTFATPERQDCAGIVVKGHAAGDYYQPPLLLFAAMSATLSHTDYAMIAIIAIIAVLRAAEMSCALRQRRLRALKSLRMKEQRCC